MIIGPVLTRMPPSPRRRRRERGLWIFWVAYFGASAGAFAWLMWWR